MSKKILTLDNVPVINKKIGKIDTIEKLKASTIYSLGDVVEVLGFHAKGDGSHHKRIAKAEDDGSGELGQGGIWWCVVHSGEVNVSWFGARGDGVTDDTNPVHKAIMSRATVSFEPKTYYLTLNGTLFENQLIKGNGAFIKTDKDIVVVKCAGGNVIENLNFKNSSRTGTAISTVGTLNNIVSKCQIFKYANGMLFGSSVGDHRGNQINSVFVNDCTVGYNVGNRGEYTTFTNCTATGCDAGLQIIGGNTHFVGGNICDNKIGIKLSRGDNDAHGFVASTSLKHNTQYSIYVDNPSVSEFFFDSLSIYYGNIYLKNCEGIFFRNSTMDTCVVYEEGAINCEFKNIGTYSGGFSNVPNHNSTTSYVRYIDVYSTIIDGEQLFDLNGGALEVTLTNNQNTSAALTTVAFNKVNYNAINRNVSFKYYNWYDTANQKVSLYKKRVIRNWSLDADAYVCIINSTNLGNYENIEVRLVRDDGKYYILNRGVNKGSGANQYAVYTFGGTIQHGNYKLEIYNPLSQNLIILRNQADTDVLNYLRIKNI